MSCVAVPTGASPEPAPQLDLRFVRRGSQTWMDRRLYRAPFVVTRTFQLERRPAHMATLIVQTSSGAVQGGDRLRQRIEVEAGAAVQVRTQGATPVHGAAANLVAQDHVDLIVAAGGHLEFLPEPRILFPGAGLSQSLHLTCESGAVAVVSDAFTLHDPGGGGAGFRYYGNEIVVRVGGRDPVLIDRVALHGLPKWRGKRAAFRAFGTLIAVLPLAAGAVEALCGSIDVADLDGVYAAATPLSGDLGLALRIAAADGRSLRAVLDRGFHAVRRAVTGEGPAERTW